jgi:hypothetical protein
VDCSWTLICHNGVPPCLLGRGVPTPWGALGTKSIKPGLTHTKHVLGILGKVYNMRTITLTPAYGRDYSSKANVLADWDANKDFVIQDMRLSGYVNKAQVPDLIRDGITAIQLRYNLMTKVIILKLN